MWDTSCLEVRRDRDRDRERGGGKMSQEEVTEKQMTEKSDIKDDDRQHVVLFLTARF